MNFRQDTRRWWGLQNIPNLFFFFFFKGAAAFKVIFRFFSLKINNRSRGK